MPVRLVGRFALRAPIDGVLAERHLNPGQEWRADAADGACVNGAQFLACLEPPSLPPVPLPPAHAVSPP